MSVDFERGETQNSALNLKNTNYYFLIVLRFQYLP